jgi:hypothetical protein
MDPSTLKSSGPSCWSYRGDDLWHVQQLGTRGCQKKESLKKVPHHNAPTHLWEISRWVPFSPDSAPERWSWKSKTSTPQKNSQERQKMQINPYQPHTSGDTERPTLGDWGSHCLKNTFTSCSQVAMIIPIAGIWLQCFLCLPGGWDPETHKEITRNHHSDHSPPKNALRTRSAVCVSHVFCVLATCCGWCDHLNQLGLTKSSGRPWSRTLVGSIYWIWIHISQSRSICMDK